MGRVKISRKKILQEPDEFLSLSQRVWFWVHENQSKAAAIVGGVAGMLVLGILVNFLVQRAQDRRTAEVARAVGSYVSPKEGTALAPVMKTLEEIAAKHPGAADGELARYFLAGALAAKGEVDKAAQEFAKVEQASGKENDLGSLARVAKAYLALAKGDADGALAGFREAVAAKDTVTPRAQLQLEIAELLEKKGRIAEARQTYQDLEKENPEGTFGEKAKERLRLLEEKEKAAS